MPDIMKKPSSQPHRHAGPPGAELDAEAARVAALEALALLDTAPEPEFDQLTQLAADIFEVPMVAVSLVARTRQWFKSSVGLEVCETEREISFCTHTIGRNELLVVADARKDPRFAENPLVAGSPGIRFYAGAPLRPD
ncbi:GAF domain-containing protein, partial [Arthrospira platensis SPKY2]